MKGAERNLWKHAIIYTEITGGIMKSQPRWATREDYEEAKRVGYLVDPSHDTEVRIPLAMVAFVDVVEVWDFRLTPAPVNE